MEQITSRLKLHGNAHWSMISEKLKGHFQQTCTSWRVQGKNFIWEKWKRTMDGIVDIYNFVFVHLSNLPFSFLLYQDSVNDSDTHIAKP